MITVSRLIIFRRCTLHSNPEKTCALPASQQGSMLVLAMFAIVVLSLIGISMASMVQSSEKTIVYEVMGERAEQASLVGIEILAHAIKPVNGNLHICETSFNLDSLVVNTQGFEGCTIVVRCTTRSIPVSGNQTEYHYEIKSTGTCAAGDMVATKSNTYNMTKPFNY